MLSKKFPEIVVQVFPEVSRKSSKCPRGVHQVSQKVPESRAQTDSKTEQIPRIPKWSPNVPPRFPKHPWLNERNSKVNRGAQWWDRGSLGVSVGSSGGVSNWYGRRQASLKDPPRAPQRRTKDKFQAPLATRRSPRATKRPIYVPHGGGTSMVPWGRMGYGCAVIALSRRLRVTYRDSTRLFCIHWVLGQLRSIEFTACVNVRHAKKCLPDASLESLAVRSRWSFMACCHGIAGVNASASLYQKPLLVA